jgi:uncharacterized membrane protein
MAMLVAAAAAFLLLHLVVSGTRVRDAIVGRIGEGPYMGLFSLASIAGLVWLGFSFAAARSSPDNATYWSISRATRDPALALVLIGFLLAVPGLLTNSPTRVRGGALVDKADAAKGMMRISRNPFLWGVAVWALAHVIANGRTADLILFGSLLVLAIAGSYSIDAKRQRALGARYAAFTAATSNFPFAAIVQGRQSLRVGEIWWRLLIALVAFGVVAHYHPRWFGVNPFG